MIEILHGTKETVRYSDEIPIKVYLNEEVEDFPIHWHSDMEVVMPLENNYTVEISGKKYVINVNEIGIIPSSELHRLYSPKSGKRLIMLFDCGFLYNLSGFSGALAMLRPFTVIRQENNEIIHKKLVDLLYSISDEYFKRKPFYGARCYSMLVEFFVIIGRVGIESAKSKDSSTKKHNQYIEKFLEVCEYIDEHSTENITIDEMADIAGFSKYHFSRLFKQYMNISCYDYITEQRIINAQKLLTEPGCTIMEAAMKAGFNSISTFNRVFKSKRNCTPSEFIELNRK